MPAMQMLQSGNYVVSYVGTEPYLRKPPLVNWIIAATRALFPGHTQLPEKNQEDSATSSRATRRVDAQSIRRLFAAAKAFRLW